MCIKEKKIRTHTGHTVVGAGPFREQSVSDLPGEDGRTLPLKLGDLGDHVGGGDPGLTAPNGPRTDRAGLVVPTQDLGHATVGHLEDARYVAGPGPAVGQFDDLLSGGVRQGSAVHVHPAELVDATVAWKKNRKKYLQ